MFASFVVRLAGKPGTFRSPSISFIGFTRRYAAMLRACDGVSASSSTASTSGAATLTFIFSPPTTVTYRARPPGISSVPQRTPSVISGIARSSLRSEIILLMFVSRSAPPSLWSVSASMKSTTSHARRGSSSASQTFSHAVSYSERGVTPSGSKSPLIGILSFNGRICTSAV